MRWPMTCDFRRPSVGKNWQRYLLFMHVLPISLTCVAEEPITWQRVYRADVLPDAKGAITGPDGFQGAFRQQTKGKPPSIRISEAKTLLYRDEDSNRRRYLVGTPGSSDGTAAWNAVGRPGTTIEMRLKVLVGAGPGTAGGLQIATGNSLYFARIRTDGIESLNRDHDALGFDFHSQVVTIRCVLPSDDKPGLVQFVDAKGRTGQTQLHRYNVAADNSFGFSGGGNGDPPNHLEWEIETIRWTHAGAFAWDTRLMETRVVAEIAKREAQKTRERQAAKKSVVPIRLNRFRQLFIDDYLIDEMHSVRRNIHSADKHPSNPIINGDHPWLDGFAYLYGAVERNPETNNLRMWYQSFYRQKDNDKTVNVMCLAESQDGLSWTYPKLGIISDARGSKQNNFVVSELTHSGFNECITPTRDLHAQDPKKQYRSLFWANGEGYRGTYSAWSPDGIHWKTSEKPISTKMGDAGSTMYDRYRRRWIFFARPIDNQLSRAISFSNDFETWTPLKVIFQADKSKREDFYNMQGLCYEGLYLGFVTIMWEEPGRYVLEPHLALSRDGDNWQWVGRYDAFIPHGPRGSWEEFNTQMGTGEPIHMGDKLYFYYSGRTYPHRPYYARSNPTIIPKQLVKGDVNIGLATLRVDGFASLEDHFGGGSVETKPLTFAGQQLHVNANSQHGELRVEVLDHSGEPISGFTTNDCLPIRADQTDTRVYWKDNASLQKVVGQSIRLKFYLNKTALYSFWIE